MNRCAPSMWHAYNIATNVRACTHACYTVIRSQARALACCSRLRA